MNQDRSAFRPPAGLRRDAEARIQGRSVPTGGTAGQADRLVHELQVHQIELELQNEELRQAREQAEAALERYTRLYDHAPVGYFTLDGAGAIRQLNLAAARLLGDERPQLVGRFYREFVAPEHRSAFCLFLSTIVARRNPATFELCLAAGTADGQPRWLRLEAAPAPEEQAFSVMAMDISERKAAEGALLSSEERARQAQTAAERANQAKSRFMTDTSQELRHPLTHLVVTANLLASNLGGNLTPQQVDLAEQIAQCGDDLRHLVDDLQDLASIESGTLSVEPKAITFPDLLTEVRRGYHAAARHKGLEFGIAIEADVPATIRTAPLRVQQILRALLGNAIKFTRQGSVTVRIRLAKESPGGIAPAIAIDVVDTGIGMTAEVRQNVFRLFQPETGAPRLLFDSAGLGLPIVRDITRLLGGELAVSSAPDQGSTFTLYLPTDLDGENGQPA